MLLVDVYAQATAPGTGDVYVWTYAPPKESDMVLCQRKLLYARLPLPPLPKATVMDTEELFLCVLGDHAILELPCEGCLSCPECCDCIVEESSDA